MKPKTPSSSSLLRPSSWGPGVLEEKVYSQGFKCIAGLDEVGRGPWAGPVVAAAVILPRGVTHPEIKDSKLLASKKREELAIWIKEKALSWGLGTVGPEDIDRMNILRASLLAMACAFGQLESVPDCLLIDGIHKIPVEFLDTEGRDSSFILHPSSFPHQHAIMKGDQLCLSIAAASIVAKVARDQMMVEYDSLYPEYGFAQHKGYGSRSHSEALNRHGPCPIHRLSFRPIQRYLSPSADPLSLFLSPFKGERKG